MPREVKIGNTLFLVNSFSSETAKETAEQLLKRVILYNAEREFKSPSNIVRSDRRIAG